MKDKPYPKIRTSTFAVLLAGASVALPIACTDDDRIDSTEGGAGGENSTGGKVGSGGASTGGKIGDGGGGAGGGPASGGASSGGASAGGASSGGANTGGSVPDGSVPDGGDMDGGDGGDGCSGSLDANSANLCLTFLPETVQPVAGDLTLNNVGTVVVVVFNKEYPAGVQDVIAQKFYPAPPTATPGSSEQVALNQITKIGFNNLPDTVYVRAYFVDNPNWFARQNSLTWGLQVGGLDLNDGIRPQTAAGVPKVRSITLTKNSERAFDMRMTAMKKFTTTVMLFPGSQGPPAVPPPTPADDGQGPLSVGVFAGQAPVGAPLFGGVEGKCVNVLAGPITGVEGFFYTLAVPPAAGTTLYFGAQVNDFNTPIIIQNVPAGALVSLTGTQTLPPTQKATVLPEQYSAKLDNYPGLTTPSPIFLTAVNAVPDPKPATYQCPVVVPPDPVDAGND